MSVVAESYYSQTPRKSSDKTSMPLTSQEFSQMLCQTDNWAVNWFVGDLARLPIKDMAWISYSDIFSLPITENFVTFYPGQYLDKGCPIKITSRKFIQKVQDQLTKKDYSNPRYQGAFPEHFTILSNQTASLTKTITAEVAPSPTQHDASLSC